MEPWPRFCINLMKSRIWIRIKEKDRKRIHNTGTYIRHIVTSGSPKKSCAYGTSFSSFLCPQTLHVDKPKYSIFSQNSYTCNPQPYRYLCSQPRYERNKSCMRKPYVHMVQSEFTTTLTICYYRISCVTRKIVK
jgi:hypothetical protein